MPNDVLTEVGSPITFQDSGGTVAITLQNLGFGSGWVSAAYDKGVGSKADWAHVHAVIQFETTAIAGEIVEVYVFSHDGTNVPAALGVANAAVTVANKRFNLPGPCVAIYAEAVTADLNYEKQGFAYVPMRYISVMVWNGSAGDNLQNTANINKVILTLLNPEIQ